MPSTTWSPIRGTGGSFPFGSPEVRRLRVGRYRVLYEITDDEVSIVRIARVEATG